MVSHHFHPESWTTVREGGGQALTGARAGRATEHRKDLRPGCRDPISLCDTERRDLTAVIENRLNALHSLIANQLPVADWHAVIGEANQGDAICDRLLHDAHRIELKGGSVTGWARSVQESGEVLRGRCAGVNARGAGGCLSRA